MPAVSSPGDRHVRCQTKEEKGSVGSRRRIAVESTPTFLVLHDRRPAEHLLKMLSALDGEGMVVLHDAVLAAEESSEVERGRDGQERDPICGG